MKTFKELVYNCLNEGIIDPALHVDLDGIIEKIKKYSIPEYWNDFVIIHSKHNLITGEKYLIDKINFSNQVFPVYITPIPIEYLNREER